MWSLLRLCIYIITVIYLIEGIRGQRAARSRSASPFLLRSLSTTDGASDEDDEEDATATTGATATGPLCQLDCSEERLRPVCGSDGITYPSRCHLQQAVCQGNDVRLDYRGECSDSETRCLEERVLALKTSNESGIPVFVPVCRDDGSYVDVQCHYGTGYCWCVNQEGKPVPGTSIRYDKPKCKQQERRRRNRRGKKKKPKGTEQVHKACTQADRSEFNSHVTELIMSEYGSLHGRTMPEGKISDHKKERIEWKFDQMDVNRNGRLRKKEFKSFRRKVFRLARNKICARNFWQYCDMDNDAEITRGEWSNCLGVNINISFRLFMSLSSEEDQMGKRRKDKQRKRKEEDDDEANRDDEIEVGNAGSALLDSPDPSKERADCRTVHREAIESTRSGVPNAYIPECDANGNFNRVQCHKLSKYCWCADATTGEPISHTSVFNAVPDCSKVTQSSHLQQQQQQQQPWKKCPEDKKKIFQVQLMDFLTKMVEIKSNDSVKVLSGKNSGKQGPML